MPLDKYPEVSTHPPARLSPQPIVTYPGAREPVGPMIGAAIIVILLMLGALYFWGAEVNRQRSLQQLGLDSQPL
jgi:hypothetical protein